MPRRRHQFGLVARTYPASKRWRVDQDYLSQLAPAERRWLADFLNCYYGADFRDDDEGVWDVEARRAVYRANNAANADVSSLPGRVANYAVDPNDPKDILARVAEDPGRLLDRVPDVLNSPAYKAARDAYRRTLHPSRYANPRPTPEHARAKETLHATLAAEALDLDLDSANDDDDA